MKEFNEVMAYLPSEIRESLERIPISKKEAVNEIRIRTNKPIALTINGKSITLEGSYVTGQTMKRLINNLCNRSEYSHAEEMNEGFITFGKGHRAGICGTAVYTKEVLSAVREVTSVNIRIAKQINNAADEIYKIITGGNSGEISTTVIASVPGGGKTTAIRALARAISNSGKKVSLIDERGEMQGFDVGNNTDLLINYKKSKGILLSVRSLSPDVIICDEIGDESDVCSFAQCLRLGVPIISTVHAKDLNDIVSRKTVLEIIKTGGVKRIIFLEGPEKAGKVKETVKCDDIFN